ncbi:interferon alpha-inducible protein 27-like protein 2 isoform X1 [Gadus chalcogrammus]|uniref:interferon alpha-inducible protein 27-like protein 2 isoform X1 n=1 Tax=Gadus chalcogrammus TaxID=1042646 RepID=UPI0024C26344|nr:interferon alpha-inducible protein 27-like protein 2 isoform X1 [Gadus chalcogrammus]
MNNREASHARDGQRLGQCVPRLRGRPREPQHPAPRVQGAGANNQAASALVAQTLSFRCCSPDEYRWAHLQMGLVMVLAAGTLGAGGAVVAAPFVLGAAGFAAAGITAGSWAAGMMSAAAIANGGAVAAGTTVAVLQSLGAAGLGAAATAATATGGGAAAALLALLF